MFKKDIWMSKIIGEPAYHLIDDLGEFEQFKNNSIEKHLNETSLFVDTKISTQQINKIKVLNKLNFSLIDTNVTFELNNVKISKKGSATIENVDLSDENETTELAKSCFEYSRFHLDPLFDDSIANTIKEKWVGNFFTGQRGDFLFVAKIENNIAGFIQILDRDEQIIIDLIGVSSKYRRQYVAHDLMAHLTQTFPQKKIIKVGTQISNCPSIRMYENFGFRLHSSNYVFHYHSSSQT
jgi:hypothetical protein